MGLRSLKQYVNGFFITKFIYLLSLITLASSPACYSAAASGPRLVLPENITIHSGDSGVPTYIKGENLSSHLDEYPFFQTLKKQGRHVEIAYHFLQSWRELFRIEDPRQEFKKAKATIDELQFKHIRFQQVFAGIPLWAREVSIHLNSANQVYLFQGHYEPTLRNLVTTAGISGSRAAELAVEAASCGAGKWQVEEKRKYIFMVDPRTPRLVFRITLVRGLADREYYFVDAVNGGIVHKISGTPTPRL